jgi:tRNA threonylcarbamoyladenosine biosynthesis protein TsaB
MNVLAFDTCFGAVSAAVRWKSARGEWLLREAYEPLTTGHAERLLPMIDAVMTGAGLTYHQLDRIAVTIGPGGFTGLRVGVAAARAMALATGKPVVGLTSLAAMAERANLLLGKQRGARPLVIAVDARRGAVYIQAFGENAGDPLTPPALLDIAEAVGVLPAGPSIVAGSGAVLVLSAAARSDLESVLPDLQPHARQLALLASVLPTLHPVIPLYLRPADAKPPSQPPLPRRA